MQPPPVTYYPPLVYASPPAPPPNPSEGMRHLASTHAQNLIQGIAHRLNDWATDVYAQSQHGKNPRELIHLYCERLAIGLQGHVVPHKHLTGLAERIQQCFEDERSQLCALRPGSNSLCELIKGMCAFREIGLESEKTSLTILIEEIIDPLFTKSVSEENAQLFREHKIWCSPGLPIRSLGRLIPQSKPSKALMSLQNHIGALKRRLVDPVGQFGNISKVPEVDWSSVVQQVQSVPDGPEAVLAADRELVDVIDRTFQRANLRSATPGSHKQCAQLGIAYMQLRYQLLCAMHQRGVGVKSQFARMMGWVDRLKQWQGSTLSQSLDESHYRLQTELVHVLKLLLDKPDPAEVSRLHTWLVRGAGWAQLERLPHRVITLRSLQKSLGQELSKPIDGLIRGLIRQTEDSVQEYLAHLNITSCEKVLQSHGALEPLPKKDRLNLVLQLVTDGLSAEQISEWPPAVALLLNHGYLVRVKECQKRATLADLVCKRRGTALQSEQFFSLLKTRFACKTNMAHPEVWGRAALCHLGKRKATSGHQLDNCKQLLSLLKKKYPVLAWKLAWKLKGEQGLAELGRAALLHSSEDSAILITIRQVLSVSSINIDEQLMRVMLDGLGSSKGELDSRLLVQMLERYSGNQQIVANFLAKRAEEDYSVQPLLFAKENNIALSSKQLESLGHTLLTHLVAQDRKKDVRTLLAAYPLFAKQIAQHLLCEPLHAACNWIGALSQKMQAQVAREFCSVVSNNPNVANVTALFLVTKATSLKKGEVLKRLAHKHTTTYQSALTNLQVFDSCFGMQNHLAYIKPGLGEAAIVQQARKCIKRGICSRESKEREVAWQLALDQQKMRPDLSELSGCLRNNHTPSAELSLRWLKHILAGKHHQASVALCYYFLQASGATRATPGVAKPLQALLRTAKGKQHGKLRRLACQRQLVKGLTLQQQCTKAMATRAEARYRLLEQVVRQRPNLSAEDRKRLVNAIVACLMQDQKEAQSVSEQIILVGKSSLESALVAHPSWKECCTQAMRDAIKRGNKQECRKLYNTIGSCLDLSQKSSFLLGVLVIEEQWATCKRLCSQDKNDPQIWLKPRFAMRKGEPAQTRAEQIFTLITGLTAQSDSGKAEQTDATRQQMAQLILQFLRLRKNEGAFKDRRLAKQRASALTHLVVAASLLDPQDLIDEVEEGLLDLLQFVHSVVPMRRQVGRQLISCFPKRQKGQFLQAVATITACSEHTPVLVCGHALLIDAYNQDHARADLTAQALFSLYSRVWGMCETRNVIELMKLVKSLVAYEEKALTAPRLDEQTLLMRDAAYLRVYSQGLPADTATYERMAFAVDHLARAERLPTWVNSQRDELIELACCILATAPKEANAFCFRVLLTVTQTSRYHKLASALVAEYFPRCQHLESVEQIDIAQKIAIALETRQAVKGEDLIAARHDLLVCYNHLLKSKFFDNWSSAYFSSVERLFAHQDTKALSKLRHFAVWAGRSGERVAMSQCFELCAYFVTPQNKHARWLITSMMYGAMKDKQVSDGTLGLMLAHLRLAVTPQTPLSRELEHEQYFKQLLLLTDSIGTEKPIDVLHPVLVHAVVEWLRASAYLRLCAEHSAPSNLSELRAFLKLHDKQLAAIQNHRLIKARAKTDDVLRQHLELAVAANGALHAQATRSSMDFEHHFTIAYQRYTSLRTSFSKWPSWRKRASGYLVLDLISAYLCLSEEQMLNNSRLLPTFYKDLWTKELTSGKELRIVELLCIPCDELIGKLPNVAWRIITLLWTSMDGHLSPQHKQAWLTELESALKGRSEHSKLARLVAVWKKQCPLERAPSKSSQ